MHFFTSTISFKKLALIAFITLTFTSAVDAAGIRLPGTDSPLFYLVASLSSSTPSGSPLHSASLQPLRLNGGTSGGSNLSPAGTGPIGTFFLYQGSLLAHDTNPGSPNPSFVPSLTPIINSFQEANGCSTFGQLGWVGGFGSNKCARYGSRFHIQSNEENSQLGAKLTYDWVGGFYVCGAAHDVWYKLNPTDGPVGTECAPIELYTVPVLA